MAVTLGRQLSLARNVTPLWRNTELAEFFIALRASDPGAPGHRQRPVFSPKESDMTLLELDTGNTAWVLTSAALVLLMTPGLALFYGGMVRAKSVLNMMMMSFGALALISVLWVLYGYSISFGDDVGAGLLGNPLQYLGLKGLMEDTDASLPAMAFVAFQAVFAIITVALISGAIADRAKFGTWMIFAGIWATVVYFPVAHWVFDFTLTDDTGAITHVGGWIANNLEAIDFAGGTAVHINAGAAGLALAIILGLRPRLETRSDAPAQHDPRDDRRGPAVVRLVRLQRRLRRSCQQHRLGRVGEHHGGDRCRPWAGCSPSAFVTDTRPPSVRRRGSWPALSPSPVVLLGQPGRRDHRGLAGVFCALAVGLKYKFGYDDSFDVGVHLIGGLWGTLAAGLLLAPDSPAGVSYERSGLLYGGGVDQLWRQAVVPSRCCSSAWC